MELLGQRLALVCHQQAATRTGSGSRTPSGLECSSGSAEAEAVEEVLTAAVAAAAAAADGSEGQAQQPGPPPSPLRKLSSVHVRPAAAVGFAVAVKEEPTGAH